MSRCSRLARAWILGLPGPPAILMASAVAGLSAQSGVPALATAIDPDSVAVGETFTLGLTVSLPATGQVRFPAVLPLPEELEQRGAVEIRSAREATDWRAYYTLVAWKAEAIRIPPIEVTLERDGQPAGPLTFVPPVVQVLSILPAGDPGLELRDARPFLRVRAFPWWLLLLLIPLVALAWWTMRRRRTRLVSAPFLAPAELALQDFARLRAQWASGAVSGDQFFDEYEHALRRYVDRTRTWSPGRALVGLTEAGATLIRALQSSLVVRFGRVLAHDSGPPSALDAAEGFVRAEMPADDGASVAEAGEDRGGA